jgi:hypothetical protein
MSEIKEVSSTNHFIIREKKKYHWISTVKGKIQAEKIKTDWKKTGNLVRIIPSDVRGYYKIYAHYIK